MVEALAIICTTGAYVTIMLILIGYVGHHMMSKIRRLEDKVYDLRQEMHRQMERISRYPIVEVDKDETDPNE